MKTTEVNESLAIDSDPDQPGVTQQPKGKKFLGFESEQRDAFWRLVKISRPEGSRIACGILALLTNSVTNLSFPWILGQAVDRADDPNYMAFVGGTAGVYLIGSIASWVRVYCLGTSTDIICAKLKKSLFNCFMDKELFFYDSARAAELAQVLDKDAEEAAKTLTERLAFAVRSLNSSINGSILLVYSAPELCGISLAMVPVVGVGAMVLSKLSKRMRVQLRTLQDEAASFALERLQKITTVRLNAMEEEEKGNYEGYIDECYTLSSRHYFAQGSYMSFTNLMTNASLMGLGWYGLASCYFDMGKSLEAAKRVFRIIDTDCEDRATQRESVAGTTAGSSDAVALQDISFAYAGRRASPVLRDINVKIPTGSLVAFAGRSGSGKSTLAALMCGLYQADSGTLHVCNKNVTKMLKMQQRRYLQDCVGVVQQESNLLRGTIRSNIAYDAFISSFPDGYDTAVGEGGRGLSGGQQARIAIARALIKAPKCLILDEATAALDSESEGDIISVLRNLVKDRSMTIIVFTHSQNLMRACENVHLLQGGRVVQTGSYDSLSSKGYLVDLQDSYKS
eukprot:GSChrysophyteH1.ASY1.ANO1.2287.1 assembled CDS